MYTVLLTTKPKLDDFRDDYFPRVCGTKDVALSIQQEIEKKGGVSIIKRGIHRDESLVNTQKLIRGLTVTI